MQPITVLCTIDDFSADRHIDRLRNKDAILYVDESIVDISHFVDKWMPNPTFSYLDIVYADNDTILFFINIHEYEVFEYSRLTKELIRHKSRSLTTCYEQFAKMCNHSDVMAVARALRFALLSEVATEKTMIDIISHAQH